jgi:hypothetical protein
MRLIIAAMDDERGLEDDLSAERRVALVAAIRTYRAAELAAVEAERDRLREALRALLVFHAASADALAEAAPDYRAAVLRARGLAPDTLEENIAKYGPLVPECDGASATAEHAAAPPSVQPASEPPNAPVPPGDEALAKSASSSSSDLLDNDPRDED